MKIKEGFVLRSLGNEQIVAGEGLEQINFSKLISLNTSAAYLWKEIEGKEFDEQVLAALLVRKYAIDENTALVDARELTDSWEATGIVEIK